MEHEGDGLGCLPALVDVAPVRLTSRGACRHLPATGNLVPPGRPPSITVSRCPKRSDPSAGHAPIGKPGSERASRAAVRIPH